MDEDAVEMAAQDPIPATPVTLQDGAIVGTVTFVVQDLSPGGKTVKFTYTFKFREPIPEEDESEDAEDPEEGQIVSSTTLEDSKAASTTTGEQAEETVLDQTNYPAYEFKTTELSA